MATCKIEGCGERTKGQGLCRSHYQRWRRGSDMAGRSVPPPGPLTRERLASMLSYDPESGHFTQVRTAGRARAGQRKGWDRNGYTMVAVDGREYRAHRLAWLFVHGRWPTKHLDHINGDTTDNRIENLREVDDAQNHQNIGGPRSTNTSGFLGVHVIKGRYRAAIQVDGRNRHLGMFDTPEEAHAAYVAAKNRLHPYWARKH